jgi:hypothetical protein
MLQASGITSAVAIKSNATKTPMMMLPTAHVGGTFVSPKCV